jgi:TPR repeat protein
MLDTRVCLQKPWLAIPLLVTVLVRPIQGQTREEVVLWESIKDSDRVDDFLGYLDKYPDGTFSPLAKRRLRAHEKQLYDLGTAAFGAKNDSEALRYFQILAEFDYPDAENCLGLMSFLGRGLPQNSARAVFWYRKAAGQGNGAAQQNLGDMYRNGVGVSKDIGQALIWYRKALDCYRQAAQQGDSVGKNSAAWLLATSPDARLRDANEAVKWAEDACAQTSYKEPAFMDTLAAAYAEQARWDAAVQTEQKAIQLLTDGRAPQTKIDDYKSRLALYQESKPYHQQ